MNNDGDFLHATYSVGNDRYYSFLERSGSTWTKTQSIAKPSSITTEYTVSTNTIQVYPQLSRDGLNFFVGGIGGIKHYKYNGSTWSVPLDVTTDDIYVHKTNKTGTKVWALTTTHLKIYTYNASSDSWSEETSTAFSNLLNQTGGPTGSGYYLNVNSDDTLANVLFISTYDGTSSDSKLKSYRLTLAHQAIKYVRDNNSKTFIKETATDEYEIYSDRALTTKVTIPTDLMSNGTYNANDHHADIGDTRTNGSVTLTEVADAADEHIIDEGSPATVTQGTLTIHSGATYRYHVDTFSIMLPGAKKYTFQNATNVTTAGARFNPDSYWRPGETSARSYSTDSSTAPTGSITVDSNGYQTAISLATSGRFKLSSGSILIPLISQADTYSPRATTTAETEDVFDTQDYWVDPAFNANKEWPTTVGPASAKIIQNHPSTTTLSQNGTKFVRTSGFTKWQLEVEYPAMTKEQFNDYQAVANAVQGQNIPFKFVNRNADSTPIIFNCNFTNTNGDTAPELVVKAALGDSVLQFGGFDSNQTKAFNKGEIVIFDTGNNNGSYNVVVHDADANQYGEVKVRFAYPITQAYNTGNTCFKNPTHVHVTLAADDFEYTIGTNGYYYLVCKFDLDEYK